eukprot:441506-Hanusia_phi.AAC.1
MVGAETETRRRAIPHGPGRGTVRAGRSQYAGTRPAAPGRVPGISEPSLTEGRVTGLQHGIAAAIPAGPYRTLNTEPAGYNSRH